MCIDEVFAFTRVSSFDICNRRCKTNRNLVIHSIINSNICESCNSTLKSIRLLKEHKRYVHEVNGRCICDRCDKRFGKKSYFAIHYRSKHIWNVHNKTMRYLRKSHLHETNIDECIFESIEEYKCELYEDENKSFTNSITLKVHIRITHVRQHFYACDVCEMTTKTATNLFTHIRRQHWQQSSSIRLFDCEKCVKSFKSISDILIHFISIICTNVNTIGAGKCF